MRRSILVLLCIISSTFAVEFKCEYHEWVGWDYGCVVTKGTIQKLQDSTVTKISGEHMEDKSDKDVVWVSIESRLMSYFPKNLGTFFPNLSSIYIAKSKLKEIHSNDFTSLGKLKNLFLDYNEIAKVDIKAFQALPTLHSLSFDFNKCHSNSAYYNRTAVLNVIGEIKAKCYNEDDFTTIATPTAEEAIKVKEETTEATELDEDIETDLSEMEILQAKISKLENEVSEIAAMRATILSYEEHIVNLVAQVEQMRVSEEQLHVVEKEAGMLKKELSLRNREIANLKSENANYGRRIVLCDGESEKLRIQVKDCENLRKKIDEKSSNCDEIEAVNEELKAEIEQQSEDIERLQLQCDDKISSKQAEIEVLEEEKKTLEREIEKLEENAVEISANLTECKATVSNNFDEKNNLRTGLTKCDVEIASLTDEILDLKRENEEKISDLQIDYENLLKEMSKVEENSVEIAANLTECRATILINFDEKINLRTSLAKCDAEVASLTNEISDLKKENEINEERISNLSNDKQNLLIEMSKVEKEMSLMRVEKDYLRTGSTKCGEEISNLKDKISDILTDHENLNAEILEHQITIKKCSEQISGLTSQKQNLLVDLETAQNEISQHSSKSENLRNELSRVSRDFNSMKLEHGNMTSRVTNCETDREMLRYQLGALKAENGNLRTLMSRCEDEMSSRTSDKDCEEKVKSETENLRMSIAMNDAKISTLLIDNEELKVKIAICDQHASNALNDNEILRSILTARDNDIRRCDTEMKSVVSENGNLKGSLGSMEIRLTNLIDENFQLAQMAVSSVDLENLRTSLATTHEAQLSGLTMENEKLMDKLMRCEGEIFNLHDDIRELDYFNERIKEYTIKVERALDNCKSQYAWCMNSQGRSGWNH